MATPLSADQLLTALRTEGVHAVEHDGWRTHNRNAAGPWGPVNGVLTHHTADTDSLDIVWAGRSDLPGPLAHTHLAKDGTATMTGNGRANHAGLAARNAFDAVVAESSVHPAPDAGSGTVDGNQHFYGLEIENLGNGSDPYPAVQYGTAVRWAAAICRAHGWTADSVVGHKETSVEGKIDPSFSMTAFRGAVAERLAHPADWNPALEDDMPQYVNLGIASAFTLAPGAWDSVEFSTEWTDEPGDHVSGGAVWALGPCRFAGSVSVSVDGLAAGATVQVRMSEYDGSTLAIDHPVHEITGTGGISSAVVPLVKRLGAGRGMRVRLLNNQSAEVSVTSAVLTAMVWKEA